MHTILSGWSKTSVVVVNVLDCDILVSKFELQWRYYVQFRTNALGMKLLIPPAMCLNVPLLSFYKYGYGIN